MKNIAVLDHPLAQVRLATLRDKATPPEKFRRALQDIAALLLVEAAKRWTIEATEIETPLTPCAGVKFSHRIVFVPILRAGLGLLDGMLRLVPEAHVGHIGLYRDPETLRPVSYYTRLPNESGNAETLLLDPMLATGHSACAAAAMLKAHGATRIQLICVLGCPDGVAQFQTEHHDVPIVAAAIDPVLNEYGYIVPGLGDAGDRYFGTG